MGIDIILIAKHKDTAAARFAIRASLDAGKLPPEDFAEAFNALLNESGALSLQGKPIFRFPDGSVAAWEVADSSWTIFGSVAEILE